MMTENTQHSLTIGQVIHGKWIVLEFIAKGGMGEVYRAHQMQLKRDVAIKVISKEWLADIDDNPTERETGLQRFRNEVQAMARMHHPNVLQIYDYGSIGTESDGATKTLEYIAMEYVPGGTLRDTMSEEGLDGEEGEIVQWIETYFFPVLDGVQAIHDLKMVHRDLKPGNVLMDGETPKIADFGLAHSYDWRPVTQSIDVKGTPAYMSPEHFFDFAKADRRSDIYSLGKILYEVVTGRMSPKTKPISQVFLEKTDTPFSRSLDAVIRKATIEAKEDRFDSIDALREALQAGIDTLRGQIPQKGVGKDRKTSIWYRPVFIWSGIALAVISMATIGIWHLWQNNGVGLVEKKKTVAVGTQKSVLHSGAASEKKGFEKSPETLLGKDGIRMRLVKAGDDSIAGQNKEIGDPASIASFYIDETSVTNYHFVEFLNAVKERLTITDGLVKENDRILFYIGSGKAAYEQIIFEHERFHVKDAAAAGAGVVRVTWYGAKAYTEHYGKRLPTAAEWRYAETNGFIKTDSGEAPSLQMDDQSDLQAMHATHMGGQPKNDPAATHAEMTENKESKPKSGARTTGEWAGASEPIGGQAGAINAGYRSLVVGKGEESASEAEDFRYPWEGFPGVGFRCAKDTQT